MSSKTRKFEKRITGAQKEISEMTFKDLKRTCIVSGMPFELVKEATFPDLQSWYIHNGDKHPVNHKLLDAYDDYIDSIIKEEKEKKGEKVEWFLLSPQLRLGYVGEKDENGDTVKVKRVKGLKKEKKVRKEKTAQGVFSGTKKALTYELCLKGMTKEEVLKEVLKAFSDAKEKSVAIWYNKAKKNARKK